MVGAALLFVLVEGSMVTIFKTLDAVIAEENVYSADDGAVLMPRSASGGVEAERAPIMAHLLDLNDSPRAMDSACALRADYVFAGSRRVADDAPALPGASAVGAGDGAAESVCLGRRGGVPCEAALLSGTLTPALSQR
jgi:hypothetical protein